MYINHFVLGVPYGKTKRRGDKQAPLRWTGAVRRQTQHLPCVQDACLLKVTFFLPPDKYPEDLPYGPDLDNLLKRFLDALNATVFRGSVGHDSCVLSLLVMKTKVSSPRKAGVHFEVLPVSVGR